MKKQTFLIIGMSIILLSLLLIVGSDISNQSKLGTLTIKNSTGWNIISQSGAEQNLTLWTSGTDKKVEIGFIIKPNMTYNTIDKCLFYANNQPILDDKIKAICLKYETAKCAGQNCYHISLTDAQAVNINNYIKLGNQTIVIEYQDAKKLEYINDFSDSNITLVCNDTVPDDVFIYYNNNSYKFGANGNWTGLKNCKYTIVSNSDIKLDGLNAYVYQTRQEGLIIRHNVEDRHNFDFSDICNRKFECHNETGEFGDYEVCDKSADCLFNFNNGNLEVTFNSDKFIDPTIYISEATLFADSIYSNVTQEANFTHLTISEDSPYNSLVAYYPFDVQENTAVNKTYDYSSNNKDGTLTNGVAFNTTNCPYGNCYTFDGVDDYVLVNSFNLNGTGEATISLWFNPYSVGGQRTVFVKYGDGYTIQLYRNSGWSTGTFGWLAYYYNTTGSLLAALPSITLGTNQWYNTAYTLNSSGYYTAYVNGNIVGQAQLSNFGYWILGSGTLYLSSPVVNGTIDEVMIFNTSLNSTQITAIYNNQSQRFKTQGTQTIKQVNITSGYNQINLTTSFNAFMGSNISARLGAWDVSQGYNNSDLNGNNGLVSYWHFDEASWAGTSGEVKDAMGLNNGTGNGGVNTTASGVYYRSGNFNGSSYISKTITSSLNITKNITISAWIKKANLSQEAIIVCRGDKGSSNSWRAYCLYTGSSATIMLITDGTNTGSVTSSDIDNNWHLITGTVSFNSTGANISIYIDGIFNGLSTPNINSTNPAPLGDGIGIGARNYNGGNFNGSIDDVMIFNRSLTSDEVKELYVKGRALWNYTSYQNLSTDGNLFNISTGTTNLLPDFKLLAGNSSSNTFYTPNLIANMGITLNTMPPTYSIISPANNSNFNNSNINFTLNLNDNNGLLNATLNIYNSTGIANQTIYTYVAGTLNTVISQVVNLISGVYTWFLELWDVSGNQVISPNQTFIVDTIYPNLTIIKPIQYTNNNTVQLTTSDNIVHSSFVDLDKSMLVYLPFDKINSSGNPTDLSTYSNNGTLIGATINKDGFYGSGANFTGATDKIVITNTGSLNFNTSNSYTWSMWAKYDTTICGTAQTTSCTLFSMSNGSTGGFYVFLYGNYIYFDDGYSHFSSPISTSILSNQWNHFIFIYNGTNIIAYLNGVKNTPSDITPLTKNLTGNVVIGNGTGNQIYGLKGMVGQIDEFMIFNRSLSESEINASFNSTAYQYLNNFSLSQSNHTLTAYAIDKGGNINSSYLNFVYDTTNPLISYGTGTVNYANLSQSNVYINTTWTETNFANITFSIYNSSWNNITTFTTPTYNINITNLGDGRYWYYVNITDKANNKNSTSIYNITLDITNPNATILTPLNNSYNNTDQNFTANLTDNYGLKNATLYIYNQTSLVNSTIFTSVSGSINSVVGVVVNLVEGIYKWFYQVFDLAGNKGLSQNYTITIYNQSVSYCKELNAPNVVYTQTTNIIPTGSISSCINITASNITFDCGGNWISNTTFAIPGIYAGNNLVNVTIRNCNVMMSTSGYGIQFNAVNNSLIINNTLNSNYYGISLSSSSNNNLTGNIVNSNKISGIYFSSSLNNTLTGNNINSTWYAIYLLSNSNNNQLINNTIISNIFGIYIQTSSNNNLTANTINSNQNGINLDLSSNNNNFTNNNINLNNYGISILGSNNTFSSTKLAHNLNTNIINNTLTSEDFDRSYGQNSNISLNLSITYLNGTATTNFGYKYNIYPNLTSSSSVNSNNLTITFNATKQGIYSISLNITLNDTNDSEIRNFIFLAGNTSSNTIRYYMHADEPTHGQPLAEAGADSGAMFPYPTTTQETRYCANWIQLQPDQIINFYPIIKNVSIGWFYKGLGATSSRIQRYAIYNNNYDYSISLPSSTSYVFNTTNFTNLNITSDYAWRFYWASLKLVSAGPNMISNATQQSYADFDYIYTGPQLLQFQEQPGSDIRNIQLLSSTYDTSKNNITMEFDGTGNFTIVVNTTYLNNIIKYDGLTCPTANCTINSNSSGIINLTLSLGSYHYLNLDNGDTILPSITLLTPLNNSYNNTDVNFTANISDNVGLSGAILHIWKGGIEVLSHTITDVISGINQIVGYVWSGITDGVYTWYYQVNDTTGNTNYSTIFTLTIDKTNPLINWGTGIAVNEANLSQSNIYMNITYTEINCNITTFYYRIIGSGIFSNWTNNSCSLEHNFIGLSDGHYEYYVGIDDKAKNTNTTSWRNITLYTTPPLINITYPLSDSYLNPITILNYTVNGTFLSKCWYSNDTINNYSIQDWNVSYFNISAISDGNYIYTVYCNDTLGNLGNTNVSFTKYTIGSGIGNYIPPSQLNYSIKIVPHYYANGQEIAAYYGQNYDAISFDFTQEGLSNITILDVTPSIVKNGLILSNGSIFAKSSIISKNLFDLNIIWIGISAIGNNSVVYLETSIEIDLNNKNTFLSMLITIGESIYKKNYQIGLFIFFILIALIIYLLYVTKHKRRYDEKH